MTTGAIKNAGTPHYRPGASLSFAGTRIRDRGVDGHKTGIGLSGLTYKPRLFEIRHGRDLCHLHAPQTGSQHMAVFAVNHDDNTQTPHRLHHATLCDPPELVPVAPARSSHVERRPNGTGISFFCQYYLRLHRLPGLTTGKSPDGETTNADVVFVHGCSMPFVVSCRVLSPYAIAASCKTASLDLNSYRSLLISLDCDFHDGGGLLLLRAIESVSCLSLTKTAFNMNAIPPRTLGA